MTLDEQILTEARAVNERLIDLRHDEEVAQADLHHAIRRLHSAGGSLREIAEELGLSHQRVHQIVGVEGPPLRRHGPPRFAGAMVRFTRLARAVVDAAHEEARALGHERVGTEHLLLALTLVERGGGAAVLARAGLESAAVREAVLRSLPAGTPVRGRLGFTRRAKRALQAALKQAALLGSKRIGSEHLLLALLADPECGASTLLGELGADSEALRRETLAELGA